MHVHVCDVYTHNMIFPSCLVQVELTPSLLIKMLKFDRLSTLLMLSAEEVTPELDSTLSGTMDYQIYWLNRLV